MQNLQINELPFWAQSILKKALIDDSVLGATTKNGHQLFIVRNDSLDLVDVFFDGKSVDFVEIH